MTVHVDIDLDDDTAAVLRRDAEARGVDVAQVIAEAAADRARRLQTAELEQLFTDAEQEREDAGVNAALYPSS